MGLATAGGLAEIAAGVLGTVATWVASTGSRAAGREAQTPRLVGACERQARGFLGGALRCLACSESPSPKKTKNRLAIIHCYNVLGPVPGVDVMAKRSQGWVKCEDRLPYYRDSSCSLPLPRLHDRHHLMYNESLELTAPQHTAVKT